MYYGEHKVKVRMLEVPLFVGSFTQPFVALYFLFCPYVSHYVRKRKHTFTVKRSEILAKQPEV